MPTATNISPRTRRHCRDLPALAGALALLASTAGCSAAPSPMPALTCTLAVPPSIAAGQPAVLQWRLHNPGTEPVQVLVWGTPFEPVWFAPYVTVTRGSTALRYNGPTMKRGDPQAAQYLRFEAGQTRSASVELAPAFEVTAPGRYKVTPQITLHDVAVGAAATVPRPRAQHTPQPLACNTVEFDVL